jgi:hypothetical protein
MPLQVHWNRLGRMVLVMLTMEQNHDWKIGLVLHVDFMVEHGGEEFLVETMPRMIQRKRLKGSESRKNLLIPSKTLDEVEDAALRLLGKFCFE